MRSRDDVEAAYFALLRAREELDLVRRYGEYLADERRRIRRFRSEGAALDELVPRRRRRALAATDRPLAEALEARLSVIEDELRRLPDRLAAAESYVEAAEREHDELRRAS